MNKDKIVSNVLIAYIKLIKKTCNIEYVNFDVVKSSQAKYLTTFWHGYSYCMYPLISDIDVAVITTINQRGDYITDLVQAFDGVPLRVPDESQGDNSLFKLAREIKANSDKHVALACDGPLGPQHYPKDFAFVLAEMTKRQIVPITVEAKHAIVLFKRWDKFRIPLPFTKIKIRFGQPLSVAKADRDDGYNTIRANLTTKMELEI